MSKPKKRKRPVVILSEGQLGSRYSRWQRDWLNADPYWRGWARYEQLESRTINVLRRGEQNYSARLTEGFRLLAND